MYVGKRIRNHFESAVRIHEPISYFLISIAVLRREYCTQFTKCPVRRTCYLLGVHTLTHYSEAHLCYGHHCPMPPSTSTPLRSNTLYPYCSTMTSESYLGPLALQLLGWGYSLWRFIAIHTRTYVKSAWFKKRSSSSSGVYLKAKQYPFDTISHDFGAMNT